MSQHEDSRPKSRGNREVSPTEDDEVVFRRGDRVYAQKNITSGFKAGKILTVHRNGLFDVVFDDDSEALDIPASSLRVMLAADERERPVFTDEKVRSPKASATRSPQRTNNTNTAAQSQRDRERERERLHDDSTRNTTNNNTDKNNNNTKNNSKNNNDNSSVDDERTEGIPFKVGDQVEARREGRDKFRFAVVAKVLADTHSCEVVYSDRSRETLPVEFIQFPFGAETASTTANKASTNNNNSSNTNNNKNTRANEEQKKRESERKDSDAARDRERQQERETERESPFRVGMSVEARFHGGRVFYPGKVIAVNAERETATVEYSDGEVERDVPFSFILRIDEEKTEETNQKGKSNAGKGDNNNNNNKNDNNDKDSDRNDNINTNIKKNSGANDNSGNNNNKQSVIRFPIGSRVEANYQDTGKWYPGVVADIRERDGEYLYSVDYNDGDKGDNMKESALREPKPRQRTAAGGAQPHTAETHAHHSHTHSHSHHSHHSHTRDHRSEREDVDRERDREKERESAADIAGGGVQRHRKVVDNNSDSESNSSTAGAALSSSQYLTSPSKPSPPSQPRPSTAVSQTQGERQRQSERERQGSVSMSKSMPASLSSPVRVEGNYRDKGRWFPARLVRERANGNVDLVYDDGDKEEDVSPERMRPLVADARDVREVFQEGARVAANYRSGGVYYNGIVTRTKEDETTGFRYVDVLYDDGDVEKAVPVERVRPLSEEDEKNATAAKEKEQEKKNDARASKNKRAEASDSESEAMTTRELSVSTAAAAQKTKNKNNASKSKPAYREKEDSAAESQREEEDDELIAAALLSQGALVEVFDEREKKWLLARVQSVSRGKANVKMISSGAVYEALPLRRLRLPRAAASVKNSEQPSRSRNASPKLSSPREKDAENATAALALSANDLTALRALLRSKDEEIERLRETVRALQRQQKTLSPRDESSSKKARRRANESSVTSEDRELLRAELVTLHRANEDLKHSLAYLGDRFSLLVEELVAVKSRENKVAKQLQQQSEDIKRLTSFMNKYSKY